MSNRLLTKVKTRDDVEACVKMYIAMNPEGFLPADYTSSYRYLFEAVRVGKFVWCIKSKGKITAWMLAEVGVFPHANYKVFQQKYYCSNTTGMSSARSIKMLHNKMTETAGELRIPYSVSQGSPLDEANIFSKILEKAGWQRKGFLAIKRTFETPPIRTSRGCEVESAGNSGAADISGMGKTPEA